MQGNKDNCYYVYQVKLDGEVVYIGKGKGDRWKHPTSGKSHVLAFNEMYFKGESDRLVVEKIYNDLDEDASCYYESDCISRYRPKFNTHGKKERKDWIGKLFTKQEQKGKTKEQLLTLALEGLKEQCTFFRGDMDLTKESLLDAAISKAEMSLTQQKKDWKRDHYFGMVCMQHKSGAILLLGETEEAFLNWDSKPDI